MFKNKLKIHMFSFFKLDRFFNGVLISILTLFFMFPAFAEDQPMWEKISEGENVQIFIKKIPESPIIIVKGVSIFDANMLKIASVIRNNTRFKEWVPRLLQANTIDESSQAEWLEYILLDAPWPLKNREFILKKTMSFDKEANRISFYFHSTGSPLKPENDNYVRAEIYAGSFILTGIDKNKTHIEVTSHADLKGNIPDWAINYIQKVWPLHTFKGLKKQTVKNDISILDMEKTFVDFQEH